MAELTRIVNTDRGPLLVTVQRMSDRYTTRELTADDLLKAAHALFQAATCVGKPKLRRPLRAALRGNQVTGSGGELDNERDEAD